MVRRIATLPDKSDVVIAYPDEGAMKRFHTFFEAFDEVVCTKVRQGDKRLVTLKEGEPEGKHVVIVDDLVQSGGTLIECARALIELLRPAFSRDQILVNLIPMNSVAHAPSLRGASRDAARAFQRAISPGIRVIMHYLLNDSISNPRS